MHFMLSLPYALLFPFRSRRDERKEGGKALVVLRRRRRRASRACLLLLATNKTFLLLFLCSPSFVLFSALCRYLSLLPILSLSFSRSHPHAQTSHPGRPVVRTLLLLFWCIYSRACLQSTTPSMCGEEAVQMAEWKIFAFPRDVFCLTCLAVWWSSARSVFCFLSLSFASALLLFFLQTGAERLV